jgi:predicted aspartyl protease
VKAKRKIATLFFFCGLLSSRPTCATCAGNSPANPARPADAAIPRSIPLRIFRDYLVVAEGQFGDGLQHRNFVLDTGTAPSIIDTKSVRELGLATTASTMVAMGKIIATGIAILPELDLGPIQAVSLRVQVQDLSRLERDLGISVAGIIGLDVLSKSSFRLDYEKKHMEFGQVSDEGIPVSLDERTGIAVALASIEGIPARLLVDTGSDRVAVLGRNLPETKRLALRTTRLRGSSAADQGMEVQVFFTPDIAFGGKHFTLEKAYFIPDAAYPAFDGILGVRALGFRAIAYDRSRSAIFLQK